MTLTQEELNQIKNLQQTYNQTILNVGSIVAQISSLEESKNKYIQALKELENAEKSLVNSLQTKYGEGTIDINTGEITPSN